MAVGSGAAPVLAGSRDKWSRLREALQGDVVLPADDGYALAKQGQFIQYDSINPVAIAFCETPADIRTCVRFAQTHDLPLRVRSGGHNLNGWSTGEGLVIDVGRIGHATVTGATVRVGPGAQSVDALAALAPLGKQLVTGTCPTVRAGGFVSGGGVGFQTRKFGLAADRVVSAQVVLADGRIVRCSPTVEPDLFWALRGGGGGNFGIVADWEVRPIDAPRLVEYTTMWSWDDAPSVIAAWQAWTLGASRDLGSSLFVLPPNGGGTGTEPLIKIYGGYHGSAAALGTALAELTERAGVQPVSSSTHDDAFNDGMKGLYGCGELTLDQCHRTGSQPGAQLYRTPYKQQSFQLSARAASSAEISNLIAAYDAQATEIPFRFIQAFALGGAAGDVPTAATAFGHRDAQFLIGYQSFDLDAQPGPDVVARHTTWTTRAADALAPLSSGSYINFPSTRLNADWGTSNYGSNYPRLRAVKRAYDPWGVFKHPGAVA
ncbi:FAD-binding oxidoreductase [Streptomyces cyanogenus]|uniref:FAD-binding oxidoreductase n=1 Tax=Streptomyces cyanogenus TaxID=80860 RepID=UPI001AA0E442|nr:FAD-binding oxidoreductase [Streptomyces cyanogenus]